MQTTTEIQGGPTPAPKLVRADDHDLRQKIDGAFRLLFPHCGALSNVELSVLTADALQRAAQAQTAGCSILADHFSRLLIGFEVERERRGFGHWTDLLQAAASELPQAGSVQ